MSCHNFVTQTKMSAPEPAPTATKRDGQPHKTWIFTVNNYTDTMCDNIKRWDVSRICVTREVGAEGTPHLQGYVTWTRAMRFSAVTKLIPTGHWEPALVADWNYNLKADSDILVCCDNRKQGKRTDIDEVYDDIAAKKPRRDFFRERRPNYQCAKIFDLASAALAEPRPIAPIDVRWYWGPTGTGKTSTAFGEFPLLYSKAAGKWWDGYDGHDVVLFDDFRPDWFGFSHLLRLLDIYPLTVERKGGMCEVRYNTVIITCPWHPAQLYRDEEEEIDQLLRRITEIREFTMPAVPLLHHEDVPAVVPPPPVIEVDLTGVEDE